MARLLLRSGANAKAGMQTLYALFTFFNDYFLCLLPAPGVPLPSWVNDIISDAVSDPLPAIPRSDTVDFDPYSDPQPCSSFWYVSNHCS